MTDRPILFSGPMVRALLDGRKTQTRRIVKLDVPADAHEVFFWSGEALRRAGWTNVSEPGLWARRNGLDGYIRHVGRCPYGVPGDRLWVKETWADVNLEGGPGIAYRANGDVRDLMEDETFLDERGAFDYDDPRLRFGQKGLRFCVWSSDLVAGVEGSWRSSIHMPRWASRLTLAITDVRVERLQDISEVGAIAEGAQEFPCEGPFRGPAATYWSHCGRNPGEQLPVAGVTPEAAFRLLWEHINGPDSWTANPWVWAVTFEVERPS